MSGVGIIKKKQKFFEKPQKGSAKKGPSSEKSTKKIREPCVLSAFVVKKQKSTSIKL